MRRRGDHTAKALMVPARRAIELDLAARGRHPLAASELPTEPEHAKQ